MSRCSRPRAEARDVVVASIFVNPSQFGDPADLARYPRNEAQRRAPGRRPPAWISASLPPSSELYPAGFATWVQVDGPAQDLEGAHRPGHFRGVATICTKLFNIVAPHVAFFGQKDAQQVAVIRRLVRDLNLDLEIRVVPTVRDHDGLALSSRNVHLSGEERSRALAIPQGARRGPERLPEPRAIRSPPPARCCPAPPASILTTWPSPTSKDSRRWRSPPGSGTTRLIDNVPLDRGGRN